MSPLALYIEQVTSHVPVSPFQHPQVTLYPPSPQNNQIFSSFRSAPTLDKSRTNRVLIYPGAFNPPHRGHLHLLKHVFMRGAHDLNIIAAIILPQSDERVAAKVRNEGGHFMFGKHERGLLWKRDPCFPSWAWVYKDIGVPHTELFQRISQATAKDGYSLEFVPMYGCQIGSPENPPDPVFDCKTIIISDAARAAEYQLPSGRLRDFFGCTKWRRVVVDQDELHRHAKAKASYAMQAMRTVSLPEADSMLSDGPRYVEETTKATVAKATEELKAVLECRRKLDDGQWITLRFVKCQNLAPSERYNNFSSTDVREVMRRQEGIKLKEALDWMALSADLLWRCKASWIDEARLGVNFCINFQPSTEDLLSLEEPPSYEDPPSYDDPPSLEELDRVKNIKASPLVEEPPLLEYSTPYDVSPSIQEPQTTEEHPLLEYSSPHDVTLSIKEPQTLEALQVREETSGTLDKKRHFSETGLEAEAEITGNSVGGGCLAEDAKV